MHSLTHLSLCSGIGGLDLAAEWAGFKTVAQCEIDEYASKVLAKNFKGVPNLNDIRTVTNGRLREYGIDPAEITVISAGFPCQPYSLAGKGLGDSDSRDLWGEVVRVLGELQPRWFVGENTPGLFARENQRYFRRILDDLAALGYSVGWGIWGAVDVGAPHKRDRVFIVAHTYGERRGIQSAQQRILSERLAKSTAETPFGASSFFRELPDAESFPTRGLPGRKAQTFTELGKLCNSIPNTDSKRELQPQRCKQESRGRAGNVCKKIPDTCGRRYELQKKQISARRDGSINSSWWQTEPDVGRVANGISARVDRLRCLGNAVVPAQAYPIFETIAEIERGLNDEQTD